MGGLGGGGGIPIPIPAGLGGGGVLIVVLIFLALQFFGGGGSTGSSLDGLGGQTGVQPGTSVDLSNNGDMVEFMGAVADDANDLWTDTFQRSGQQYQRAVLVLFTGSTVSGCGPASSETGPFYCPADQKVYLDTDFFKELSNRFGAPGDFAQAYVIAHEVGHHVQNLLGVSDRVHAARAHQSKVEANRESVKLELQADCLAGVWAFHANRTRKLLEPGDVDEGLRAATAIGDDTLQRQARGRVVPESFTHGSSQQRVQWFKTGMNSGRVEDCDTFAAM